MSQVTIHGVPLSSYTWSARMALVEKGVEYSLEIAPPNSPAALAAHPWGKIPSLSHGEVSLFEYAAISQYVDEAFDGPALRPADVVGRAQVAQWISAFNDYLYPVAVRRIVIPRVVVQRSGGEVDEADIAAATAQARKTLAQLDAALEGRTWFGGEIFSLADILLVPILFYISAVPEKAALVGGLDNLSRFMRQAQARPSFAATMPSFG